MRRAGSAFNVHLDKPLEGKGDHLAKKTGSPAFSKVSDVLKPRL